MIDDIVKRLRRITTSVPIPCPDGIEGCLVTHYTITAHPVCAEAAAEIERLRAALREYADRLQKGADHVVHYSLMEAPRKLPNIATVVEISAGHLRDIAKDMLDAATDARAKIGAEHGD
jgi:hypothetical protein